MRLWSHTENAEVTPEDVLSDEELADYYAERAHDFRTGRRHIARYTTTEDDET